MGRAVTSVVERSTAREAFLAVCSRSLLPSGRPLAKPSRQFAFDHCSRAVDRSRSHPRGLQSITARERSTAREVFPAGCSRSLPASGRPLTKPSPRFTVNHCPRAVDRSRRHPGGSQSITARERSTAREPIPAVYGQWTAHEPMPTVCSQSLLASGRPLLMPCSRSAVKYCSRAVNRSKAVFTTITLFLRDHFRPKCYCGPAAISTAHTYYPAF